MGLKKIDNLFNPKSIAVIGASNNKNSVGYGVMRNLVEGGFKGKIYPINLKRKKVLNLKCHSSIGNIRNEISIAIIATPSSTVIDLVKECGRKNVLNVILMSSGFKEAGYKGQQLVQKILKIARAYNMRIMGPNCMGFIKPSINLNASFANNNPKKGNIAFISQSGALGSATLEWAEKHDFGFSFFASVGSMIDIGFADLIDYLGKDPNTSSILIYMESLSEARKFMSAARAFSRSKPIIVLKAGKSKQGAKAALSHTGTLAGNDEVFDAAFKRAGIIRVQEIQELFDCAKTLSKQKKPTGNKLAIITNAGGPGVIATDLLIEKGCVLPNLSKKIIKELDKVLPENWSKRNPIDLLGDSGPREYKKAIEICLEEDYIDGLLIILTPQSMTNSEEIAKEIIKIKNLHNKPILAAWMGEESIKEGKKILEENNLPVFDSPERAVKSFSYLYDYSKNLQQLYETPSTIPHAFHPKIQENKAIIENVLEEKRYVLNIKETQEFLSNYHIPIIKQELAKNSKEAVKISRRIGYPVVMKISSTDIIHKTETGGIFLNVNSDKQVKDCFNKIIENVRKKERKAKIDGISIEKNINKKYEIIIGCKKDPIFGPAIVFGMGGTTVNIFKDTKVALPPLNMALSKRLIEETKIYNLLKGYRGAEAVDLESIQFILYKFAYLIADFPEIKEIDLNPFGIDENGGLVLDAKIILDKNYLEKDSLDKKPYSHLVISPYPKEYLKKIKIKNNKEILLRPIKPEDEPLEREMIKRFSKKTQRFRFFGYIKDISHSLLIKYTQIDYDREMAIIAELEEGGRKKMAGVVRIISDPYDNSAEFAIAIADPWQGKGLGGQMMDYIIEIAKNMGIKKIYAYFLRDNDIMQGMFESRGFRISKEDSEMNKAEIELI